MSLVLGTGLGFGDIDHSWNPITGCLHDCVYCVSGDTLLLTADLCWKAIRDIAVGEEIVGFSEKAFGGRRHFVRARVISKVLRGRRRIYVVRGPGVTVKSTEDHAWLASGRSDGVDVWRRTDNIRRNSSAAIKFLINPEAQPRITEDYARGYLVSFLSGLEDDQLSLEGRVRPKAAGKISNRLSRFLSLLKAKIWGIRSGGPRPSYVGGQFRRRRSIYDEATDILRAYKSISDYARGFLAGAYDLGGQISNNLKIYFDDEDYGALIERHGRILGFRLTRADGYARLLGGPREPLRFLMSVQPALTGLEGALCGLLERAVADVEVDVEEHGEEYVYDIATTSGTFIANGFLSHNCWARRYARRLASANIEPYKTRGFSPTLVEERLRQRIPDGRFVFVSDMGDMWGDWVPRDWIEKVLRVVRSKPRTKFLFLTKNPKRYIEFVDKFSGNVVLGATIETNRDYGLNRAPPPEERYEAMRRLDWRWKAIAIEPILEFDEELIEWIHRVRPCIVYVGYDNYRRGLPEPKLAKTKILLEALAGITDLRPKTIRKAWYEK